MAAYFATRRPSPESCVDRDGRLKPESREETQSRALALEQWARNLPSSAEPSDVFDWDEAERDLDSFRPHRPLFRPAD